MAGVQEENKVWYMEHQYVNQYVNFKQNGKERSCGMYTNWISHFLKQQPFWKWKNPQLIPTYFQ